jgi:hypothetical protein
MNVCLLGLHVAVSIIAAATFSHQQLIRNQAFVSMSDTYLLPELLASACFRLLYHHWSLIRVLMCALSDNLQQSQLGQWQWIQCK